MSSVAQCSLKNLCCGHRGPPYTCMCMHHPKIMQEVEEPLPLDLQVTSHKPHVFSGRFDFHIAWENQDGLQSDL